MTVQFQIPYVDYTGNGSQDTFTFTWTMRDDDDLRVEVDGVLQTFGVHYELREYDPEDGGEVVFFEDYIPGAVLVRIYRRTPVTQELDYEDYEAFPADAHEEQMDKDTLILQEIIAGGLALGGPVDLAAVHYETTVDITNTSGTDATILPWVCQGDQAGVFHGEVTDAAPLDGDATLKPDGYVWYEIGTATGDDRIIISTAPVSGFLYYDYGVSTISTYFTYEGAQGRCRWMEGYGNHVYEGVFSPPIEDDDEYWVMMEEVSGTWKNLVQETDTWYQASGDPLFSRQISWGVEVVGPGPVSNTVEGLFKVAPDDGTGQPDLTRVISKPVTLTVEIGAP